MKQGLYIFYAFLPFGPAGPLSHSVSAVLYLAIAFAFRMDAANSRCFSTPFCLSERGARDAGIARRRRIPLYARTATMHVPIYARTPKRDAAVLVYLPRVRRQWPPRARRQRPGRGSSLLSPVRRGGISGPGAPISRSSTGAPGGPGAAAGGPGAACMRVCWDSVALQTTRIQRSCALFDTYVKSRAQSSHTPIQRI